MDDKKSNIYTKLFEIQQQLKVNKSMYNKFGNYYYRSAESILQSVKPILQELGLVILFEDELRQMFQAETTEDKATLYKYVFSTVKLIDIANGEEIKATAFAREPDYKKGMDECQLTGSTMSYARKYALGALFAIDDGNDSDSHEQPEQTKTSAKEKPKTTAKTTAKTTDTITKEQAVQLSNIGNDDALMDALKSRGYKRLGEIKKSEFNTILSEVNRE